MDVLKGATYPDAVSTTCPSYELFVKYPRKRIFNYSNPYKYLQSLIDRAGSHQNITCHAILRMLPVLTPDGIMFQIHYNTDGLSNPDCKPCMIAIINNLNIYMIDGLWYLEAVDIHVGPSNPGPNAYVHTHQTPVTLPRNGYGITTALIYAIGHYENVGDEE